MEAEHGVIVEKLWLEWLKQYGSFASKEALESLLAESRVALMVARNYSDAPRTALGERKVSYITEKMISLGFDITPPTGDNGNNESEGSEEEEE